MKAEEIRQSFSHYFSRQGHEKIPSSSLIPQDDPTLLFVNAGMNQFKDYFTGRAKAKNLRATTIQKCVRAGGKHNDLENVGLTARHHTFFEMLGNFSFGDYFKKDAIHFAWEWLTKELVIPKEKLYVSVHHSDDEAQDIWHKQEKVPLDRIFKKSDKDNFWEMGEYGPCGPCSEIFYDHGEQYGATNPKRGQGPLDNEDRYVEIWNLVFMQFEKTPKGIFDLPRPSIDTGAGLERLATLMQGKYWNYDCDIFSPLISQLKNLSSQPYQGEWASSFRVVADHIRGAIMLITDGIVPSSEGRGYVLRRIIRRAIRHLRKLEIKEVALCQLVPTVLKDLGKEYPQNLANETLAKKVLEIEEKKFLETLDTGMKFLENTLSRNMIHEIFPGKLAFKLYDTYGFPKDLTEVILKEKNLKLDLEGFEEAMIAQKKMSKKSWKGGDVGEDHKKLFYDLREKCGATTFSGYEKLSDKGTLLAKEKIGDLDALVFNRTPFYGEAGGQVGDHGHIFDETTCLAKIIDTQRPVENLYVLYSKEAHALEVGKSYTQTVEGKRRQAIMKNHSSTHLLQSALMAVLGHHVKQAGSHVSEKRLRFDFTHPHSLSKEELASVELHVNEAINKGYDVSCLVMSKEEALKKGALAMFGEKYGEHVRVVQMGEASTELCGGTHVCDLTEIGFFTILSETSLSSGIRRIEAMTSQEAFRQLHNRGEILKKLEQKLSAKGEHLLEKLHILQNQVKELHKENSKLKDKIQSLQGASTFENPEKIGDLLFKPLLTPQDIDMKKLSDQFVSQYEKGVLLLYGKRKHRLSVLLRVHKKNKKINCADILKKALGSIQGRGGGRPDMAQGSGDEKANIPEFIQLIMKLIKEQ